MNTQNKTYRALRELLYHEKGEMLKIDNTGYESLSFFYDSDDIEVMLQKGWIEEVKETPLVDQDGRFVEEPEVGQKYWFIVDSEIGHTKCVVDYFDRERIEKGNCYISEEAAERFRDKQKLDVEIKRWIAKNDPNALKLDWKDINTEAAIITYSHSQKELYALMVLGPIQYLNAIYFSTSEKLHQCLKDIGEERIKSLFVEV